MHGQDVWERNSEFEFVTLCLYQSYVGAEPVLDKCLLSTRVVFCSGNFLLEQQGLPQPTVKFTVCGLGRISHLFPEHETLVVTKCHMSEKTETQKILRGTKLLFFFFKEKHTLFWGCIFVFTV